MLSIIIIILTVTVFKRSDDFDECTNSLIALGVAVVATFFCGIVLITCLSDIEPEKIAIQEKKYDKVLSSLINSDTEISEDFLSELKENPNPREIEKLFAIHQLSLYADKESTPKDIKKLEESIYDYKVAYSNLEENVNMSKLSSYFLSFGKIGRTTINEGEEYLNERYGESNEK